MSHQSNPNELKALTTGYSQMIEDRTQAGWSSDLVTILFDRMNGSQSGLISQMRGQIQRVYSTLVTRVHRKPKTAPTDQLPLVIGAFDLPVYKKDRTSAPMVYLNEGLHFHGVLMVPPNSRLKEDVADHFATNSKLYRGNSCGVGRIDVRPIIHNQGYVLDYVLKTIGNHGLSYDDAIVVLPRARAELSGY